MIETLAQATLGHFLDATLLDGVTPEMRVYQEEICC